MSRMDRRLLGVFVVAAVGLAAVIAYLVWPHSTQAPRTPAPSAHADRWDRDPTTLLESYRGRVLVLLLGMEDCPGTRAATDFLKGYIQEKGPGASIVRLDVPPPVGEFRTADAASLPFACGIDRDRLIAEQLGFFYYPTLYILDGDGEVRFSGECDPERVRQMVAEIAAEAPAAEQPGAEKHIYTPPLPAIGTTAPSFSGTTLDGTTVSLDELRGQKATVLIFARTGCPFSVEAVPSMQQLANDFRDKEVTVVIVNGSEPTETMRPVYAERAPEMTVVDDATGEVSHSYSGDAVPYTFVLDAQGTILDRMPYTFETATAAVNQALGLAPDAATPPKTGAG